MAVCVFPCEYANVPVHRCRDAIAELDGVAGRSQWIAGVSELSGVIKCPIPDPPLTRRDNSSPKSLVLDHHITLLHGIVKVWG